MRDKDQVIDLPEEASDMAPEGSSLGPPDPWTVDIDVYLEPEGTQPSFYLETYLPVNEAGEIVFQNHLRNGFIINFNLKDPHNTGFLFPNNKDEALYSAKNKPCPPPKGQWPQFQAVQVKPENTTLVVRNHNQGGGQQGKFCYMLRVKNAKNDWRELDPGGDNQNGPIALSR